MRAARFVLDFGQNQKGRKMRRRNFAAGLVALAGAGMAPGLARADLSGGRMQGFGAPVQLWLQGIGAVRIDDLVLSGPGGALRLQFRAGAALFDENRADFSGAGPVAPLFRTPFPRRWREAAPLGEVGFADGRLIGRGIARDGLAGRRVTLGAEGVSWDLPGILQPAASDARTAPAVGQIRQEREGTVLVYIPARAW